MRSRALSSSAGCRDEALRSRRTVPELTPSLRTLGTVGSESELAMRVGVKSRMHDPSAHIRETASVERDGDWR